MRGAPRRGNLPIVIAKIRSSPACPPVLAATLVQKIPVALTLLPILLLKTVLRNPLACPLWMSVAMPSMAFSLETGDYAILGIAGIRYITYRQAHPARSPILLFNSVLRTLHLLPLLLFNSVPTVLKE